MATDLQNINTSSISSGNTPRSLKQNHETANNNLEINQQYEEQQQQPHHLYNNELFSQPLKIKTKSIENTLLPLVNQVWFYLIQLV